MVEEDLLLLEPCLLQLVEVLVLLLLNSKSKEQELQAPSGAAVNHTTAQCFPSCLLVPVCVHVLYSINTQQQAFLAVAKQHAAENFAELSEKFEAEALSLLQTLLKPHSRLSLSILETSHTLRMKKADFSSEEFMESLYPQAVVLSFHSAELVGIITTNQFSMVQHLVNEIAICTAAKVIKHNADPGVKGFYKGMQEAYAQFNPTDNLADKVGYSFNQLEMALTQKRIVMLPSLVEHLKKEAKFDAFKAEFKRTEIAIKEGFDGDRQRKFNSQILNGQTVGKMMSAAQLTVNEVVTAHFFDDWFMQTFAVEPEHVPHMNWTELVFGLVKTEMFTPPAGLLEAPNCNLGLLCLCGQLMQKNIPQGLYFNWSQVPCFASVGESGTIESKSEILVKVVQAESRELKMDPLYLAQHFPFIVNNMNWLVNCKDPSKNTPFGLAILQFESILECAVMEKQREERLAAAAEQKAARLKKLAELEKRAKEEFECVLCASKFTYYYPPGEEPPYQEKDTALDIDKLCLACKQLICHACNQAVCTTVKLWTNSLHIALCHAGKLSCFIISYQHLIK